MEKESLRNLTGDSDRSQAGNEEKAHWEAVEASPRLRNLLGRGW